MVGVGLAWRSDAGGQVACSWSRTPWPGDRGMVLTQLETAVRAGEWECPVLHATVRPGSTGPEPMVGAGRAYSNRTDAYWASFLSRWRASIRRTVPDRDRITRDSVLAPRLS